MALRQIIAEQSACLLETDDCQAGASSFLKLRGTFSPPSPSPCPLVPAVEPIPWASIPMEVCSLLNLISAKQGGSGEIVPWGSEEHGSTIFKSLSAGHFSKCPWTQLSKQNFLKNLSKLRPCSIWPKMDGCSKTLNFLKLHLLQHYFWSLNVTFSVFKYRNVCLTIHKSVKLKAPCGVLHWRTLGVIYILPSANDPGSRGYIQVHVLNLDTFPF